MHVFLSAHWLDLLGTLIGLVYVYQEYKANVWLWITGIIMPVVYMFVYWDAGLYADFGMQVYYALAAIYGLAVWKWGKKRNQTTREMPITHVKRSLLLPSLFLFLIAWGVLYLILSNLTNSTVPVLDSFGNALSFIGLWWLARKYLEQWWIWVVVDVELSALYVYKGIPFTAGLYALYVFIAIAGFFKWRKMMHQPQKPTRP
ncbi:nicotinamide riboside transporter PnuC [Segatella buccae]|uniref:nicotinamide riboside transporter PnuC n=1 Tax=Segatella buccae TaxID=28126 RepID=UPI0022E640CB|nr:nicotinamide riboside transporter PnuC [Segatella buccae]